MPRPKKKKVAVVEPTEVDQAMLELKQAQQELELAAANERVAQMEHRAAELELEAVRAEQEAEDVLRRAHTSAQQKATDAAKQWALAEKKLLVAKRRQTSKRPTPAREWPAKEAYLTHMAEIRQDQYQKLAQIASTCEAQLGQLLGERDARMWRERAEAAEALAATACPEHEAKPKRLKK